MFEEKVSKISCKEAAKMIPGFIASTLSEKEMAVFIEHIENCPACKEELSIQHMVTVGLEHVEKGDNVNLDKELSDKLNDAKHAIKVRASMNFIAYLFFILALLTLASAIILLTLVN